MNVGWIVGAIILLVSVIISLVVLLSSQKRKEIFGKYKTEIFPCSNGNQGCEILGQMLTVHTCVTNNGRGCLNEGKESFLTIVEKNDCFVKCVKYEWEHTIGPCVTLDECINSNTTGTALKTLKCVQRDSTGDNECIIHELVGEVYKTSKYNLGDIKEVQSPCTNFSVQHCGVLTPTCSDHILDEESCPVEHRFEQSTMLIEVPCTFDGAIIDNSLCGKTENVEENNGNYFCRRNCIREGRISVESLTSGYCVIEKSGKGVLGLDSLPGTEGTGDNREQKPDAKTTFSKYFKKSDFVCQFGKKGERYRIRLFSGIEFRGFLRYRKGKLWWQQEKYFDINSGGIIGNNAQTFKIEIISEDSTPGTFSGYCTSGKIKANILPFLGEVVIHLLLDEKVLSDRV